MTAKITAFAAALVLVFAATASASPGHVFLYGERVTITIIGQTSGRPCAEQNKNRCGAAWLDLRWGGRHVHTHMVQCIQPRALVLDAKRHPYPHAYVRACGQRVHDWRLHH